MLNLQQEYFIALFMVVVISLIITTFKYIAIVLNYKEETKSMNLTIKELEVLDDLFSNVELKNISNETLKENKIILNKLLDKFIKNSLVFLSIIIKKEIDHINNKLGE